MPAVRSFCDLLGIEEKRLSKEEQLILEAELFARIYEEIKEIIKEDNREYYRLLKLNSEKEKSMIDVNFIRCIINDILSTEEYTLPGIAYYTDTPEEVIFEVASGRITSPTFFLCQKIIDLHRAVRPQLYSSIVSKIRNDSTVTA